MNRRLALRLVALVSCAGALSIACSAASDGEDSSGSISQAERRTGTDDPPVLTGHDAGHDAGHDSGYMTGPILAPPNLVIGPAWATACTTNRYFVRRKPWLAKASTASASLCTDVDSPTGKWTGAPLFPEAPLSPQCIYDWTPDAAHALATSADFASLESVAEVSRWISTVPSTAHPDIKPQCAPTTCGVGPGASCVDVPSTPACDDTHPDAGPDGGCHHGETGPICESCAVIHDHSIMVVLPPQIVPIRLLAKPQGTVGVEFIAPANTQTFRVPVTASDSFPDDAVLDILYPLD